MLSLLGSRRLFRALLISRPRDCHSQEPLFTGDLPGYQRISGCALYKPDLLRVQVQGDGQNGFEHATPLSISRTAKDVVYSQGQFDLPHWPRNGQQAWG